MITHVHQVVGVVPAQWACLDHVEAQRFDTFAAAMRHEVREHPPGVPNGLEYASAWVAFRNEFVATAVRGEPPILRGLLGRLDPVRTAAQEAAYVAWFDHLRLRRQPAVGGTA